MNCPEEIKIIARQNKINEEKKMMTMIRLFVSFSWYKDGVEVGNGRLILLLSEANYGREDLLDYIEEFIKNRFNESRMCRIVCLNVLP